MSKELFISSSPHETKVAVLEDDELVEVYFQRDTDVGLVGGIYKGRVSRVLPGMQSAFVDIGLGRDAFLYVSDFFEDSEEYDKVFTEAESRVAKYVEEPAAASSPQASSLSPGATDLNVEPPPAEGPTDVTEAPGEGNEPAAVAGGAAPTTDSFAAASRAPVSTARAEITAVGPTAPLAPAGGQSSGAGRPGETQSPERREEHRGRRRRRRGGRFGESRPVPKGGPHERSEWRPSSPAPSSAPLNPSFEVLPGESLAKYGHVEPEPPTNVSGPAGAVEAAEESAPHSGEEPIGEQPVGAAPSVELAAPALEMPQETTAAISSSTSPLVEGGGLDNLAAAEAEPVEDDQILGDLRVAPVGFQPDSPGALPPAAAPDRAEAAADVSPLEAAEPDAGPDASSGEVSETDAEIEATGEAGSEEAAASADEASTATENTGTEGTPAEGRPEAGERAYTLNEPHQRPRFAPRRGRKGRGRFGHGSPRPEGGVAYRREPVRGGNTPAVQITEVLKEGQEILVQIAKEPLGTKGARITSHIALPGRYLVYMPTIHHLGVSRKIASEDERLRLRNVILENRGALTGGFIVRTAGAGKSEDELKADLKFLSGLWAEIRSRSERSKAPALLHRDLTLVERILRDVLSPDFKCVRVDSDLEYAHIVEFVNRFQPSLVGHVKLYTRDTPLYEEFGVQAEIDKALKPKVWLKSGGYIVINQTEALVAVDVNTGKYVGKTNRLEDTIVKTNIDAVKEIVRQIRLRDLGGIIVIDFIDMDDRRNRLKVVQALEEALRSDRAPTKILSFNEFGLVALTRKRVKQSLERTLSEPCSYCTGSGWIKSVSTVCNEILAEARKMAREIEGNTITLRVSPEVAKALKSREGVLLAELEALTQKDVVIRPDPAVHQERFEIF